MFKGALWLSVFLYSVTELPVLFLARPSERSAGQFLWETEGKRSSVHSGHGEESDFNRTASSQCPQSPSTD